MKHSPARRLALLFLLPLAACQSGGDEPKVVEPEPFVPGDEIVICGERYSIGAPVILWDDPGGYDAYATELPASGVPDTIDPEDGRRYTPGRVERGENGAVLVAADSADKDELGMTVDQFVIHYDACGTSELCFDVLQEQRGLSVHFLLDIDGTIYQTLDCRDQAWHAAKANARSIGIEIAQRGAYPPIEVQRLEEWYDTDATGPYITIPEHLGDGGVRTEGFVGRPRAQQRLSGVINGRPYAQYDFTPEQYDSLAKLVARITRELPSIRIDCPRGDDRRPSNEVMSEEEYEAFAGILGHFHVTDRKVDPGPAFDFEEFLIAVRRAQAQLPLPVLTPGGQ